VILTICGGTASRVSQLKKLRGVDCLQEEFFMKAISYEGVRQMSVFNCEKPTIQAPTDAFLRVTQAEFAVATSTCTTAALLEIKEPSWATHPKNGWQKNLPAISR
jgi:hypothetical protein